MKLANEHHAFNQDETNQIIGARTLESKWITALNIGYCKAFGLLDIRDRATQMSRDDNEKYERMLSLIQTQLNVAILIRNKITHGQWRHPLNSQNTALNPNTKIIMEQENYLLIRSRANIFEAMTELIHYLCVSEATYKRDYDKYILQIDRYMYTYDKQGYESFKRKMVDKYKRGQLKKQRNKEELEPPQ
ncbi:hypothetical protein [Paenibacillus ferrarius]|uniref:hypothetical protein n=1 Tax=Paenibacillus ferrarius TaxID=1469647 RepID=UPI003D2B8BF0